MDVGDPSNFVRILQLFEKQFQPIKNLISSDSVSDEETKKRILGVFNQHQYLLDPQGAVVYAVLKKYLQKENHLQGLFLETAHPVKFYDVVEPAIQQKITLPDGVKDLLNKKKERVKMKVKYDELRDYLRVDK